MLEVSTEFMDAMGIQTNSRKTYGRVEFKQIDVAPITGATVTATSTESISSPDNIVDGNYINMTNYATFETDRWKLDGSFKLLPIAAPYGVLSWWSSEISGVGGTFATPQVLTRTFLEDHSSIGFTIIFDETNNEYAVDFELVLYDSSDVVLDTFTVTGNNLSTYRIESPVANYRKAVLTITKWSLADRRARVTELLFGLIEVYENNELIKINLVEEIDPVSVKSPQNQLIFAIDNSDYAYDILNPNGVYAYLQKQMEIRAFIGIDVGSVKEYAKLGVFYLVSWDTPSRLEASFTARDRFELLQKTYRKGLYQTRSLYDLAVDVLTEEGLTSAEYDIDTALQAISVTSYIPILNTRQALQLIAFAGNAVLYMDRDNIVTIKQLSSTSTGYELDFNNAYKTPGITLDNLVKQIDVNVSSFNAEDTESEIFKGVVTLAGTQDVWVDYKDHATDADASVDVGVINSATYYTCSALLNITYTGAVTITITGKKLNKYTYPVTTTNEDTGDTLKVDNQLITSNTQAADVGTWIKTEKNKRKILTSSWRQNPALEAGDIIDIETQFSTYEDTRITKQIINYNGALSGTTEVRG